MDEDSTMADSVAEALEQGARDVSKDVLSTGLGVDIVEIGRMEQILQRSPGFTARVFSEGERAYCERCHRPAVHYATHFAAKEAVLKALGTGFSQGIKFTDVEVGHDKNGRPVAVLHGRAAEIADERGVLELPLSLSRTSDTAVANAIAVTASSKPVVEEKASPRQELAKRFKELRGMLDYMDAQVHSEAQEQCVDGGGDETPHA